ncbi:MAG: choice-of-anchor D domain-containing protein [Blastocatellia bacterium]|nr:choice-of-anchor D domain-containing protein [Blastocatellia bacterium]
MISLKRSLYRMVIGLILTCAGALTVTAASASQGSGVITVSASSYDFGGVVEQVQEVNSLIDVSNTGTSDLVLTDFTLAGQNPTEFHFLVDWPLTLVAGDHRSVIVSFMPTSAGQKSAVLQIKSSATNQAEVDIQLTGNALSLTTLGQITATATPSDPNPVPGNIIAVDVSIDMSGALGPAQLVQSYQATLSWDPTVLDYYGFIMGDQPWGNPDSIGATTGSVTWHDATMGVGGKFSIVRLKFRVIGGANSSTALTLGFSRMEGPSVERLLPILTCTGGTVTVAATAASAQAGPQIAVSPASHDFGAVAVGASASQTIVVSNKGTTDLTVNSTTLQGTNAGQFSIISGGGSFVLPAGGSQEMVVGFNPTQVGPMSTSLLINSNDPDEGKFFVLLSGNNLVPDIDVTPTSLDFGDVSVGSLATQTLVISNKGTNILSLSEYGLDGHQLQFSYRPSTYILLPGMSGSVEVTFNPTELGAKTAVFVISSNDPDEGVVNIPLKGNGVPSNGVPVQ